MILNEAWAVCAIKNSKNHSFLDDVISIDSEEFFWSLRQCDLEPSWKDKMGVRRWRTDTSNGFVKFKSFKWDPSKECSNFSDEYEDREINVPLNFQVEKFRKQVWRLALVGTDMNLGFFKHNYVFDRLWSFSCKVILSSRILFKKRIYNLIEFFFVGLKFLRIACNFANRMRFYVKASDLFTLVDNSFSPFISQLL